MIYPEPLDEIPAEFAEIAAEKREEFRGCLRLLRRPSQMAILEEKRLTSMSLSAIRAGVLAGKMNPSLWFYYKNKGIQNFSTPLSTIFQARLMCLRLMAPTSRVRKRYVTQTSRALLGTCLQDHDRPVCW